MITMNFILSVEDVFGSGKAYPLHARLQDALFR
jgi:hypothetical protein